MVNSRHHGTSVILAIAMLAMALKTTDVYAGVPGTWLDKYEGQATACRGDSLIVQPNYFITLGTKYTIEEILVGNEKELTVRLKLLNKNIKKETIFTLKKMSGGAVFLYNYRSVENYKKNFSPNVCTYGPRSSDQQER